MRLAGVPEFAITRDGTERVRDELLKPRVREGGLVRVGEASQTLQMARAVPPLPRTIT